MEGLVEVNVECIGASYVGVFCLDMEYVVTALVFAQPAVLDGKEYSVLECLVLDVACCVSGYGFKTRVQ